MSSNHVLNSAIPKPVLNSAIPMPILNNAIPKPVPVPAMPQVLPPDNAKAIEEFKEPISVEVGAPIQMPGYQEEFKEKSIS